MSRSAPVRAWCSRLAIMWCVKTAKMEAAAAAAIGARLAARKRRELLGLLRCCFARTEPWVQAGKYLGALAGGWPGATGGRSLSMLVTGRRTGRSGCSAPVTHLLLQP